MPDPVFRRCEASAILYWEATTAPPSVSRIVVDVPIPQLVAAGPSLEALVDLLREVRQLVDVTKAHLNRAEPADRVLRSLAIVGALLEEVTP